MRLIVKQILANSDSKKIFLFLCANLMFMFVEMFYGLWTNSLGLISDACHMLFDCTALAIGLYAAVISKWPPTKTFSFGYGRVQVLSGFVNAIFLMFIALFICLESVERFLQPEEIHTERLLLVSVLGLCVNLVGLFAFHTHSHAGHDHGHHQHSHGESASSAGNCDHSHSHDGDQHHHEHEHDHDHDHHHQHGHDCEHSKHESQQQQQQQLHGHAHGDENIMGVYLHVLADTMGSVGVIISSSMVQYLGWTIADPIASLCISVMIFISVIPLLRQSAHTLLQGTPATLDVSELLSKVTQVEGVLGHRDLHAWTHSSGQLVLSLHLQIAARANEQRIRAQVLAIIKERGVSHLTIQLDRDSVSTVTGK